MIADLIEAILTYESDTFIASGSEVTADEAKGVDMRVLRC